METLRDIVKEQRTDVIADLFINPKRSHRIRAELPGRRDRSRSG